MKIVNIVWDTEDFDVEELGLPMEVEIEESIDIDEVADYLSDEYGWCVISFEYEC